MNSRREFILEGLKQAGLVFAALFLLGLFATVGLWVIGFGLDGNNLVSVIFHVLGWLAVALSGLTLVGPVPAGLTYFDISDRQLLVFSCLLLIPYWAGLGSLVGFWRWTKCSSNDDWPLQPHDKQIANQIRWVIEGMAALLAVLFLFGGPLWLSHDSGHYRSTLAIQNQLRHIDAGKSEYSLNHHPRPDYVPTEADLAPYMNKIQPAGPERYVINAVSNSPYAILDHDWWIPRRRWREGYFAGTNGTIYQLPANIKPTK